MQELFLGNEKVFLLERCRHFRGVLGEGFDCNGKEGLDWRCI